MPITIGSRQMSKTRAYSPCATAPGDNAMLFGLTPFTLFHVVLSLVGIGAGFVALRGWLESSLRSGWTAVFLVTTIATTLTGFLFPFAGFTPAIGVGLISAILLALAVFALYRRHLLAR